MSLDIHERFEAWQSAGIIHPFTCSGGGGPCQADLIADGYISGTNDFVAKCPQCHRRQIFTEGTPLYEMIATFELPPWWPPPPIGGGIVL